MKFQSTTQRYFKYFSDWVMSFFCVLDWL